MAYRSLDTEFLTLRNVTAYNPNNTFVSTNYVFTTGTNGTTVWTDSLNINSINVSTLTASSISATSAQLTTAQISSANIGNLTTNNISTNNISVASTINTGPLGINMTNSAGITSILDTSNNPNPAGITLLFNGASVLTGNSISSISSLHWEGTGVDPGAIYNTNGGTNDAYKYLVGIGTEGASTLGTLDVLYAGDINASKPIIGNFRANDTNTSTLGFQMGIAQFPNGIGGSVSSIVPKFSILNKDKTEFSLYAWDSTGISSFYKPQTLSLYGYPYGGGGANILTADSVTGNVGIGEVNPTAKLHVNGDAIISSNLFTTNASLVSLNLQGSDFNLKTIGSSSTLVQNTSGGSLTLGTLNYSSMIQLNNDNTIDATADTINFDNVDLLGISSIIFSNNVSTATMHITSEGSLKVYTDNNNVTCNAALGINPGSGKNALLTLSNNNTSSRPATWSHYVADVANGGLIPGNYSLYGDTGKSVFIAKPDGSQIDLGSGLITGGTVVNINGTSGLSRVYDAVYNPVPGGGEDVYWRSTLTNPNDITNNTSGNVGIGTITPSSKLTVQGIVGVNSVTGNQASINFYRSDNVNTSNGSELGYMGFFGYGGDGTPTDSANNRGAYIISNQDGPIINNKVPGSLSFFTRSTSSTILTERMRITSDGSIFMNNNKVLHVDFNGASFRTEKQNANSTIIQNTAGPLLLGGNPSPNGFGLVTLNDTNMYVNGNINFNNTYYEYCIPYQQIYGDTTAIGWPGGTFISNLNNIIGDSGNLLLSAYSSTLPKSVWTCPRTGLWQFCLNCSDAIANINHIVLGNLTQNRPVCSNKSSSTAFFNQGDRLIIAGNYGPNSFVYGTVSMLLIMPSLPSLLIPAQSTLTTTPIVC